MKTISTNFKSMVDSSLNPILIFGSDGKVLYNNTSAELLVGIHISVELFNLAINYAPKSFGIKTICLDLLYGVDSFYAITVLYENDDEILLSLYRRPQNVIPSAAMFEGYSLTDINMLLEANIVLFKMKYRKELSLFTDYSLPKFKIDQNKFSILLRKIFESYIDANKIDISLTIKIGDSIIIDEKKYPIVVLKIDTNHRAEHNDEHIKQLAIQNHQICYLFKNSTILEIPCVDIEG